MVSGGNDCEGAMLDAEINAVRSLRTLWKYTQGLSSTTGEVITPYHGIGTTDIREWFVAVEF